MAKRRRKKKISKKRKIIKRVILSALGIILVFVLIVGIKYGMILRGYQKEAKKIVDSAGEAAFTNSLTSTIYDANGEEITLLIGEHDSYYLEYSQIPYFVKAALITSEDRNFYSHSGIDLKAITRAFVALVQNDGEVTQGGSTITQQLARNIFLSHEVTFERKFKEMFIAMEIEKKYSKDKILEYYINNIYFGNGFYGIEAASRGYFSKSVTELSLGEIAFICSIPNNPSLYDPYVNPEGTSKRKDRILKQMYEHDDIDKQMYLDALTSTVVLYPSENTTVNYVETYVRHCATIELMKSTGFEIKYYFDSKEEEKEYREKYDELYNEMSAKLYTGGYKIYTSIDLEKQAQLQKEIDETLRYYTEVGDDGVYAFQGAATCIDNITGKTVAIVGGRSQQYNGFTLNRAYQSFRQPGSTIKPILIYTPLFERGYYPDTIVRDEEFEGGPVNSPNVYEGDMTIRYAVEKSKNTIPWKYYGEIGTDVCLGYLKKMDFRKIVSEDKSPAVSIGGMTYGVSTLEMASAYATLENQGIFRSPTCIVRIKNTNDEIIIDNIDPKNEKFKTVVEKQIYTTNATKMMTDVMKGVLISGTGRKYNIDNAICAAKTGTTNGNRDIWFVGFSKYYTTSVWVGYDMPKDVTDNYGNTCAGTIWNKYMTYLHQGLELKDFSPYLRKDGTLSNGELPTEEVTEETQEESSVYQGEDETTIVYGGETEESSGSGSNGNENETTVGNSQGADENQESDSETYSQTEKNSETTRETTGYTGGYKPGYGNEVAPGGAGVYQENWG